MIEDSPTPSTLCFPSRVQVALEHAIQIGLAALVLFSAWLVTRYPNYDALTFCLWITTVFALTYAAFYFYPPESGATGVKARAVICMQLQAQVYLNVVYCLIAGMAVTLPLRSDPFIACLALALLLTTSVSGAWIMIILGCFRTPRGC